MIETNISWKDYAANQTITLFVYEIYETFDYMWMKCLKIYIIIYTIVKQEVISFR